MYSFLSNAPWPMAMSARTSSRNWPWVRFVPSLVLDHLPGMCGQEHGKRCLGLKSHGSVVRIPRHPILLFCSSSTVLTYTYREQGIESYVASMASFCKGNVVSTVIKADEPVSKETTKSWPSIRFEIRQCLIGTRLFIEMHYRSQNFTVVFLQNYSLNNYCRVIIN